MEQEDVDLLLQDLCARLPYGVKCIDDYAQIEGKLCQIGTNYDMCLLSDEYCRSKWAMVSHCKPYLFPLSSMTEEQHKELNDKLIELELQALNNEISRIEAVKFEIDYYLENHFDYRGLIDKSLALDATNLGIYE